MPAGTRIRCDVTVDGATHPVDTGFLLYNDATYPNLVKLFTALGVKSVDSDMSFSVRIGDGALEWSDRNLAAVFAQPSNLVNPRFLRMLADLLRFSREAAKATQGGGPITGTLGEFLDSRGFGREVREFYLIPMAACVWSTPATQINRFPLSSFLRFCANHGLLSVSNRPQWRSVKGGRARIRGEDGDRPVRGAPGVPRAAGSPLRRSRGARDRSGHRALRRGGPRHPRRSVAGAAGATVGRGARRAQGRFPSRSTARSCIPTSACCRGGGAHGRAGTSMRPSPELSEDPVSLTFLINRIQPLPFASPLMLSMNPVEKPRAGAHHRVLRLPPPGLPGRRRRGEAKDRLAAGSRAHLVLRRVDRDTVFMRTGWFRRSTSRAGCACRFHGAREGNPSSGFWREERPDHAFVKAACNPATG